MPIPEKVTRALSALPLSFCLPFLQIVGVSKVSAVRFLLAIPYKARYLTDMATNPKTKKAPVKAMSAKAKTIGKPVAKAKTRSAGV